jgi:hypothetical protein
MRRRNDQFRAVIRRDRGCAVHRAQRRVRAIGADHDGLIGAHLPPSVRPTAHQSANRCGAGPATGGTGGSGGTGGNINVTGNVSFSGGDGGSGGTGGNVTGGTGGNGGP